MISITALNGNPSDSDEESNGPVVTTKEALEEEAFEVYRKALEHIQYGRNSEAEEALQQLLLTDFTKQSIPRSDPKEVPLPPGLTLRYLAYKNLAVIAYDRGDIKAAMQAYLEAVDIDMTDVSVWFKMGLIAQKLENFPLAKLCFEEGLKCSPNHKLCLDRIITLTYALNDYTACLHYIARALEKFYTYTKALAFRDQIYRDHPMLRLESAVTFKECDPRVYTVKYDKEVAQKLINEALEIRERKRAICKPEPLPTLSFQKPFENYTWKSLGENINTLYDYIKNSDPHISIACPVDLSKYWEGKNKESDVNDGEKESSPTTVTSSSDDSSNPSFQNSAQTSQSQEDELVIKKEALLLMEVDEVPDEPLKNKEELLEVNITPSIIQTKGKRKRFPYESIDPSWKRRSTRVRNPGVRKPQDNTNYMELLRKFLPSSLLGEGKEDELDDTDDPMALQIDIPVCDHTYGQSVPCRLEEKQQLPKDVEYLKTTENEDVKAFLEGHKSNNGILDLYKSFLKELSHRNSLIWPAGLAEVYTSAFDRWRNHIIQPNIFSSDVSSQRIKDNGWITLVYQELKVDKWQIKNRLSSVSPSLNHHARNGTGSSTSLLGSDFPGKFFYEDSDFLIHSMVRRDAFGEKIVEFIVRTLWQHSKLYILEGDMMGAVRFTDKIATVLSQEEETKQTKIYLVNCHLHNVIYLAHVDEKLESLQRCQSLEEVHRLYEQGEYQRVVDLLILTFTQPQTKSKTLEDGNIPERHYQLLLLQDSLWKLEVYKDCLYWGEAAFNEALQQYIASASNTTTRDWAHTIGHLLLGLDKCLNKNEGLLGQLGNGKLIRLTNNLIRIISLQMNASEFNSETNIATLTPWMLMYRLIHHEEKKILSLASKSVPVNPKPIVVVDNSDSSESSSSSSEEDLASALPSSLMLLFTAHDYLGRRSWCTFSDGAFLHLIIDVMMEELHSDKHSEDMKQGIEQCFYCLYGHPNKRTKVKHILEHNAPQATLNWERAIQLFEYFQPDVVPEFDSYKTSTVSAEIENLLRRILLLVPSDEDPNNYTESVVAYIEGGTNKYPTEPLTKSKPSLATREGFYLLGDYYFKNKEFGKASKFYILDIVVNPTRIDSWAGMALARSSQLEQRLIASDLRNDTTVYRKSCSALRCFKRALELDPTRMALWIEYGNMAYILHAYASRQLKQQAQYNFPDDIVELLKNKREEMLATAENCFLSANHQYQNCNEPAEVWLHHYMLGKIYEKRQRSPEIFLEHYRLAAEHLHNEGAKYPKKILYHAPPDLAIEGLEVYYRTHTSILKFLIRKEVEQPTKEEFEVLQRYLKIAEDSHFANFQELKESDLIPSSEEEEGNKKVVLKPQDHDYVHKHHRKKTTIQAESSSESSDSITIKELLNSIVTVVAERFDTIQIPDNVSPTIVLGDQKLKKTVSEASSPKCDLERLSNPSTVANQASEKPTDRTKDMNVDKPKFPKKFVMENLTLNDLVEKCLAAILECHQRFPQHYKSLYRLAHYYCYSQLNKNLLKSREIILGGTSHVPIPSLFGERKNANFFNGIWRVPIDEIDRPGSFATHMFRSVILLIDILRQQGDHHILTQLTTQLYRTPDVGKKYLRDTDRIHLAREAFTLCLGTLRDEMNSLLLEEPPPEESRLIGCLMDIYRTWQIYQKHSLFPNETKELLEEAYSMYKLGEVDPSPPVLEQAIRFCQSRQAYRQSSSGGQGAYSRSSSINNAYDSTTPVVTSQSTTPLPLIVPPPYAILDGMPGLPSTSLRATGESSLISHQMNLAAPQMPTAALPFSPQLFNSTGNEEFLKWYCAMLLANASKKARHN